MYIKTYGTLRPVSVRARVAPICLIKLVLVCYFGVKRTVLKTRFGNNIALIVNIVNRLKQ